MSTLLRNAILIRPRRGVSHVTDNASPSRADVLLRDGSIHAVEPALSIDGSLASETIDASRLLIAPGLVNGHLHSWDTYLKGCIENLPLEMAMAYLRPRKPVALSERQVYLRTMIVALEALRSGTTTVVDDMSLGQGMTRGQIDAALQAYRDSGLRVLMGFSMIDKPVVDSYPFVDECFDPALLSALRALPRPDGKALLDLVRELARDHHPGTSRVGVLVAPSAPHRCSDDFLRQCRSLADELDLPLVTHCQETRLQLVTAQEFYGHSLVAQLDRLGFLGPRTSLIHATWLSRDDISRIRDRGASVQYNPYSNAVIGSGLAPIRECLDAGINVSLGSDGSGILFGNQMLNSLCFGATLPKLRSPDHTRWLSADEVLEAATAGGARALGLPIGAIKPGLKADLVAYRLDSLPFTPLNDAVRQLVYAEKGSSMDSVWIDGKRVMADGHITSVNENALIQETHSAHALLADQVLASNDDAAPFRDALLRITIKALGCPIDATVRPAWIEGSHR